MGTETLCWMLAACVGHAGEPGVCGSGRCGGWVCLCGGRKGARLDSSMK